MHKKRAFSDVDGTLVSGLYIKEFFDALYKEGKFSLRQYNRSNEILAEYKKGNLPYDKAAPDLVDAVSAGIKDGRKSDAKRIGEIYMSEHPEKIFPFTEGLITMLRSKGYQPVLLSGSPEEIILPFGRLFSIGPKDTFATQFETEKGIYTGEVVRSMVEPGMKELIIKDYAAEHGIDLTACPALGDTETDAQMFELVGYPFPVKPNPALRKMASERGWPKCDDDDMMVESLRFYLSRPRLLI